MKYEKIVKLRQVLISQFSNSSVKNIHNNADINNIINSIIGISKFITIYNFELKKFTFHHLVKETLGYTDKEFTIEAINNAENSNIHIIYKDDIEHKRRYDLIIYQFLASGLEIASLADNYEISLRIIDKEKNVKRVVRQSYIFETDSKGTPISQLDIWKIVPNDNPYVSVRLNHSSKTDLLDLFYKKNRQLLGFNITKRQIEILKLRNQRLDNKSIAHQLNISLKTVENHIHKLKRNMQDYEQLNASKEQIYNMNDMLHFVRKYGLFSFVV